MNILRKMTINLYSGWSIFLIITTDHSLLSFASCSVLKLGITVMLMLLASAVGILCKSCNTDNIENLSMTK